MPTNRVPINRKSRTGRITPEVIEAYRRARKLYDDRQKRYDDSDFDQWDLGSERCNRACTELHDLLGRTCGDIDILDTIGCEEAGRSWNEEPEEFQAALAIRRELDQAAAEKLAKDS